MAVTRRMFLRAAAGIAATTGTATLLAQPAAADTKNPANPSKAEIAEARRRAIAILTGEKSANGWSVNSAANAGGSVWTRPVPGTGFDIDVSIGDVELILVHVIRRFHYEIDTLRPGDVVGFKEPGKSKAYESNHTSGTAIAIRPGWYPPGVRDGFFPQQLMVVRDILAECEGGVRWGGDDNKPYEAQFSIDVPPGDERLTRLLAKFRGWADQPGAGAGSAVDVRAPRRRATAEKLESIQRHAA